MKISQFKKFIYSLEEEDLREELHILYSKYQEVKNHYAMELGNDIDRVKIFTKAKIEIEKKYATKSVRKPRKPRIRLINNLLKDLDQKSIFSHEMIDIYLFNVECGNKFMKEYDFYNVALGNTIQNSFQAAINIIKDSMLESDFNIRCQNIVNDCTNYSLRRILRNIYDTNF